MRHFASPAFWQHYDRLPSAVQAQADKSYELLKANPQHPSLHFKQLGRFWSVRIGLRYRALAVAVPEGLIWFWIGSHAEYDRLVKG
ncbi:MAG: type II toxin-antitoxin system RelE family toxin [Oscillochloridaceae bacterium umkhey_bin13]